MEATDIRILNEWPARMIHMYFVRYFSFKELEDHP